MRQRNIGWRLDYILASAGLADRAQALRGPSGLWHQRPRARGRDYCRLVCDAASLVQPDVTVAREYGIALELGLDEGAELARRHGHRFNRFGHQTLMERRRCECLADLCIQPLHDRGGQLRQADDAVPTVRRRIL